MTNDQHGIPKGGEKEVYDYAGYIRTQPDCWPEASDPVRALRSLQVALKRMDDPMNHFHYELSGKQRARILDRIEQLKVEAVVHRMEGK